MQLEAMFLGHKYYIFLKMKKQEVAGRVFMGPLEASIEYELY